jgi:hypothetical protein
MANIENERLVEEELAAIEQNEEQMANCKHVLELVEKLSRPNPSEVSDAETNMEGLWMTNPRLLIDSMLNILTSKKFTELNDTVHQALCVTLSIYLSKYPLDSDKNEDVSTLINWLNRMSYSFFKVTESSVKLKRICLPFAKLFMFWDFYIDDSFSREVYFRFLKKNFAEAQTETKLSSLFTNLGKLLILLEVFSSEDDKLLTSSLPMLLTDSVSSLCMCSVTLCKEFSTSSKEIILEYVQNINIMIEKLLDVLVTSFGKFSSQGLDILANQDLKNHLLMVNILFTRDE